APPRAACSGGSRRGGPTRARPQRRRAPGRPCPRRPRGRAGARPSVPAHSSVEDSRITTVSPWGSSVPAGGSVSIALSGPTSSLSASSISTEYPAASTAARACSIGIPPTSGTVPFSIASPAAVDVGAGAGGKSYEGGPLRTAVMYSCQVGRETVLPQTLPRASISPSTENPPGRMFDCGWPNHTAVDIWRVKPTYQVWNCEPDVPVLPPAGWPSTTLPLPV